MCRNRPLYWRICIRDVLKDNNRFVPLVKDDLLLQKNICHPLSSGHIYYVVIW